MVDVAMMVTRELYNINPIKLENVIHRVVDPAPMDIALNANSAAYTTEQKWR